MKPIVIASTTGVPDGTIITDGDVYETEVSNAWVNKIDKNRTILRSKNDAIGKIARNGLQCGEFVYADQLSLPNKPRKEDRWLFSFSNDILEKYVGKKITLKGELFQGADNAFRILSYDSTGRIMLYGRPGKSVSNHGQCVFATGVLRTLPKIKNAPLLKYGFNFKDVTITPTKW